MLSENSNQDIQFDDWQTLITVLQENLTKSNMDRDSLLLVLDLAAQARMLLRLAEKRQYNREFLDADKKLAFVRHLSSELMSAVRISDIREVMRQDLPSIGIRGYHLVLYENAGPYNFPDPAPALSLLAVSSTGRGEGTIFPTQDILPDLIMGGMPSFSLFILPLLYRTNQIGFLVVENGPLDKSLYPPLKEQLSSSLNMDKLFQELSETKDKLQNTLAIQKSKTQVISSSSKDIYQRIENISTTMEETARSIEAVSRTINDVMTMVSKAAGDGDHITSIINSLKSQSIAVGKVTRFIYDIAEQTNVLSINAAIEAARSGDQGKGFAVVAREVKSLSQKTTSSTDEANRIIKQIQESSSLTVDGVGGILKAIGEISVFSGNITTAISEQSQAVNNISSLLVQTTESLKMISNAITEIAGM